MNKKLILLLITFFSLSLMGHAEIPLSAKSYENSKTLIVKYYLADTNPAEHLEKLDIPYKKIERVYKTENLVNRFRQNRKFQQTPSGNYVFRDHIYKNIGDIPDEEILQEAVKTLPPEAKGPYRTFRITLEDNKEMARYLLWLRQSTKVESVEMILD